MVTVPVFSTKQNGRLATSVKNIHMKVVKNHRSKNKSGRALPARPDLKTDSIEPANFLLA
jgi:hypothetical protein